MKKFSVSQLKKYNANPAERAWSYILWIKNYSDNANTIAWVLFEERYTQKKLTKDPENWEKKVNERSKNKISVLETEEEQTKAILLFESLKSNSEWLETEVWLIQQYVDGKIAGFDFCGYIDNVTDEWIEDYKTIAKAKNLGTLSQYSWMTCGDEYELQLRVYMYLTWRSKARIIEVNGFEYKKPPTDWYVKIIEYIRTKEMDVKRLAFVTEKCGEMQKYYEQFRGSTQQ